MPVLLGHPPESTAFQPGPHVMAVPIHSHVLAKEGKAPPEGQAQAPGIGLAEVSKVRGHRRHQAIHRLRVEGVPGCRGSRPYQFPLARRQRSRQLPTTRRRTSR